MAHFVIPSISIEGRGIPGLPLEFIVAGEMANHFEESYGVSITTKDKPSEGASVTGQRPHPPDMNFDHGQFDNTQFTIRLFSGVQMRKGKVVNSGKEIVSLAETLFKLSMPRPEGDNNFVGPPLVTVQYASYWRAIGLFQKVTCISEGAFDREGYPTLMTLRMEFARHFGGGTQSDKGGVYERASTAQLKAATADQFSFKPRRR